MTFARCAYSGNCGPLNCDPAFVRIARKTNLLALRRHLDFDNESEASSCKLRSQSIGTALAILLLRTRSYVATHIRKSLFPALCLAAPLPPHLIKIAWPPFFTSLISGRVAALLHRQPIIISPPPKNTFATMARTRRTDHDDTVDRRVGDADSYSLADHPAAPQPSVTHSARAPSRPDSLTETATLSSKLSRPPSYASHTTQDTPAKPSRPAKPHFKSYQPSYQELYGWSVNGYSSGRRFNRRNDDDSDDNLPKTKARQVMEAVRTATYIVFLLCLIAGVAVLAHGGSKGRDQAQACIDQPLRSEYCIKTYPDLAACARDPLRSVWCMEKYPDLAAERRRNDSAAASQAVSSTVTRTATHLASFTA